MVFPILSVEALLAATLILSGTQTGSSEPTASAAPSTLPIERQSRLEARSQTTARGFPYEDVAIQLEAGSRIVISAESNEFDTVVELYRDTGAAPIAQDDDGGEAFNSRLIFTAREAGTYIVRVQSYRRGSHGAYSLSILPESSLPAVVAEATRESRLRWRDFEGTISPASQRGGGARFIDHVLRLAANEEVILRADSDDFDTVLEVFAVGVRGGTPLASDDDDGIGDNSLMIFRAREAGDYVVRVRPLGHRGGTFRLGVGQREASEAGGF